MTATPKRRRPLTGLLTAEAISITGSRMSLVALPWLVLSATGSPTLTGLVAAVETIPYVLAGSLGAPLVDRVGARRTSIAADLASVLAVGAIPGLYHLGTAVLALLVCLAGAFRGISDLSKKVLLPTAVDLSGMPMARATTLYDGISRLGALIGGPLAGLLIAWLGAPTVVAIDASTFAVCAGLVATTVRMTPASHEATTSKETETPEPYLKALKSALSYLRTDRLMLSIVLMMSAINMFDTAALSVYIPLWARDAARSPVALGLCSGAFALGAVLGNVAFAAAADRLPRLATLSVGLIVGGAPRFLILGLSSSRVLVAAVMLVAGAGFSAINPVLGAVMYERIPQRLQARVFGVALGAAFAGMPIGGIVGGVAAQTFGLRTSALVTGGMCLAATLTPVLLRRLWGQMNTPPKKAELTEPADGLAWQ